MGGNGTDLVLKNRWKDRVLEVMKESDRKIQMKMVNEGGILNKLSASAPQIGCAGGEKDIATGKLGMWWGQTRKDEKEHGNNGYGTGNDAGSRILEMAKFKTVLCEYRVSKQGGTLNSTQQLENTKPDRLSNDKEKRYKESG